MSSFKTIFNRPPFFLSLITFVFFLTNIAVAANYTVTTNADDNSPGTLRYAINQLNVGGDSGGVEANIISFNSGIGSITLTANLPVIEKSVTMNGSAAGQVIDGNSQQYNIFATYVASLSLSNLAIQNSLAKGGNGSVQTTGSGGGGGLGAGGGIFIDAGQSLTLINTTVTNCKAQGGTGATAIVFGSSAGGGGGGGASWSRRTNSVNASGSNGGGDFYGRQPLGGNISGALVSSGYGGGPGGVGFSAAGGAGGGDGAGASATIDGLGGVGGYCGGGGGGSLSGAGRGGGGGGNGGGNGYGSSVANYSGGGGGYGSGGGGGSANEITSFAGGGGGFGGGGAGGGGTGNAGVASRFAGGGGGGWGGGGGGTLSGMISSAGKGGNFGGSGGRNGINSDGNGGGGAGIGGGVFIADTAQLVISDNSSSPFATNIASNTAVGGADGGSGGGGGSTAGGAAGQNIFLFRGASILFNGSNSLTLTSSIDGDTLATDSNKDAGVTINLGSSATIILSAASTYQGITTLTAGTLSLGNNAAMGTGSLSMGGGALQANTTLSNVANNFALTSASTMDGTNSFAMTGSGALGANVLTVANTAGTITLDGIISGSGGGITRSGAGGALSLTKANTYTGPTTITSGTLQTGVADAIANSSPFVLADASGAIFDLNNFNQAINNLSGGGASGGNISLGTATLTVNQDADATYAGAISGTGGLTKAGSSTLILGGVNSYTGGTTVLSGTLQANGSNLPSNSSIVVSGGTFDLTGGSVSSSIAVSNPGAFNVTGASTSSGAVSNSGSVSISAALTGAGSITNSTSNGIIIVSSSLGLASLTNNSGGTLTFATGANNSTPVTNNAGGIFNISGNTINAANLSNSGTMTVSASLSSAGTITNNNGGLLIFNGATNADDVTNLAGGTFNITGASTNTAAISNAGEMNISASLSGNGAITNQSGGQINIANAVNILNALNNSLGGVVNVTGNSSIADLTNSGAMNFSITDQSVYDSLASNGDVNLNNSTVNVTSSFFTSTPNFTATWDIITADTSLSGANTAVNLPANFMGMWTKDIDSVNKRLRITYSNKSGNVYVPAPGLDAEIAAVLQQMANNITNSGQQALIDVYTSITSQEQYDYFLNSLVPNSNSSNVSVSMQNAAFNKITQRILQATSNINARQDLQKDNDFNQAQASQQIMTGIATGDLTTNMQLWVGTFGNIAKQNKANSNSGYRSRALGTIFGLDILGSNNCIYGLALSVANNNVSELSNTNYKTRMLSVNAMVYGSNNLPKEMFAEWFISGGTSKNKSIRPFGLNGVDLSAAASYRTSIVGGRVNLGKSFVINKNLQISSINSLQYVLMHQPAYSESGSVAALNVSSKTNSSVLTIGTGARLAEASNNAWLNGNRDLHAMITYDVLSPNQNVTANFVVGSNDFIVTSSPARLALKVGANLGWVVYKKLQLQLSYDLEVRSGYYDNLGEVALRYVF